MSSNLSAAKAFSENSFSLLIDQLPFVPDAEENEILETGLLDNGESYAVMRMGPEHLQAVYDLLEAEYKNPVNSGKAYLLRRSQRDIEKMLAKKDPVLGVVSHNRLLAVGAIAPIADKGDIAGHGRGKVYAANDCPPSSQLYFKMAVVHPALQKSGLHPMTYLYPWRLAHALAYYEDRTCFLTKSNNPAVISAYTKVNEKTKDGLRWRVVDESEVDDETLLTMKLSRDEGLSWLLKHRPDIYTKYGLSAAGQVRQQAKQMTQPVVKEAANENIPSIATKENSCTPA